MKIHRKTTCNFSENENFVVLECITSLLDRGYKPSNIELEKPMSGGHDDRIITKEGAVMESDGYYSELYRVVKKNIDELDCYHLLEGGAPANEFDIEVEDICGRVTPDSSAEEIADIIIAVFKRWFGVNYSKDMLMRMSEEIEHVGLKYKSTR